MAKRLSNTIQILRGSVSSPQTFGSIGNVIDFNGPAMANERVEVTDGDSPAGGREYLAGRQDPGPLTFNIHFDFQNVLHRQLISDAQASPPVVTDYRMQPSEEDEDNMEGPAFVATFAMAGSSRNTALTAACGFQPTESWELNFKP